MKVGRNQFCPCGSLEKFKACCEGRVPWEDLLRASTSEVFLHLTVRGKNLAFLGWVADALGMDTAETKTWDEVKAACTPSVVRRIHEGITLIWPDRSDLARVYSQERNRTSGLYVGTYEPEFISRGVTRHSIYADHVLLVDPFIDPRAVRPEYNPLERPQEHVTNTLRNLRLWHQFAPWIREGLVS